MEFMKRADFLQDDSIGRKTAENLAIDYDENQLLAEEFFDRQRQQVKKVQPNVK